MRDARTTLLDVVESFLVHRHDLSAITASTYRRRITEFVRWCTAQLGHARVSDVEGGTVEAYLAHLKLTVSAQTARSAWVALRSLAKYLAERRVLHQDGGSVLRLVRMPKVKDETRRALTDDELWRLIERSGEGEGGTRDSAIVWTLLGCGLRRAELVGIRLGDVDLSERKLHICAATSKSVHARDANIPAETAKALNGYVADYRVGPEDVDAALFTDRGGRALTGNAVRKLFERLRVRTGILDLCAHMLRHTWATNFHRSGSGSRFDLMVEGGWTTGRMVERYTKARPFEERRRAPSPFTASRNARQEKRPAEKWPSPQISGLSQRRTAQRANIDAVV
jgi:site-specific recombinase XerD